MDDRTTTDFTKTAPDGKPATVTTAKPKSRWGMGLTLVLLLAIAAGVGWWIYTREAPAPAGRRGAQTTVPVVAVPAVTGNIDITLNALGTVTSLATVTIISQISGQLVRVVYTEGQIVKKGDLLAEIDSRPYELALAQAQGALERDQALLQTAELDLKRYQDLAKTNAIPRQQLDTQISLVIQDKGNVISDQAQIDTQKLNITYCHIVAPVNGRVGLRLVDQGNYVTPTATTGIVIITQLQPITVIFPVAEDNLPQIMKRMAAGATLAVTAYDRTGTVKLSEGELRTLDNQIDTTTGTLKLRAEFANPDNNLFPNQFVNVRLLIDTLQNVTVVPTAAIQRGAPGTFVYLVNADNSVTVKPVTLGPTSGERVAVQSGLSPGDKVVIDGADKLRNGAMVVLRPASNGNPAAATAPSPGAAGTANPGAPGTPANPGATDNPAAPGGGTPAPGRSGGGSRRQQTPPQ
jgi:membrane fusion protein, multidrug efflux system